MIRNLMVGMAVAAMGSFPALAQDWSGQITPYVWRRVSAGISRR